MNTQKILEGIHNHFKCNDKTVSRRVFNNLNVFESVSDTTIGNIWWFMLAHGVITKRFRQYRGDYKKQIEFFTVDLSKLYTLAYETVIKKYRPSDKKPLDCIINELYNDRRFDKWFSREQLFVKLMNITGVTSRTSINILIRELTDHRYIELDYGSVPDKCRKKSPNDLSNYMYCLTGRKSQIPNADSVTVSTVIKSNLSDIMSFFKNKAHNGYALTMKRLAKSTSMRVSDYLIRRILHSFIESGNINSEDIRIYNTRTRIRQL